MNNANVLFARAKVTKLTATAKTIERFFVRSKTFLG